MFLIFIIGLAVGHYKPPPVRGIIEKVRSSASKSTSEKYRYRPNETILHDGSEARYSDLRTNTIGFKYAEVLLNDYDYYLSENNNNNYELEGCSSFIKDRVLVAYKSLVHTNRSDEAVLLVYGNSSIPDDFLVIDDPYYTNGAGVWLHSLGFDIYAPYVTHNSRFQNVRRRMASIRGDHFSDLDVRRVRLMLEKISSDYKKIHVIGASYGGLVIGKMIMRIERDRDLIRKLGCALSIEGWMDNKTYSLKENNLFKWNYEMTFPGIKLEQFHAAFECENFYVAYGSNGRGDFQKAYKNIPKNKIINYEGGHEFNRNAILMAIDMHGNKEVV